MGGEQEAAGCGCMGARAPSLRKPEDVDAHPPGSLTPHHQSPRISPENKPGRSRVGK